MLARGVRVAVGTDSRASNPDLNVWEELRLIRRDFPQLPSGEILKLATLNGAEALGKGKQFGQLVPGMVPDFVVFDGPGGDPEDPLAWLLDNPSGPQGLEFEDGKWGL